MRIVGADEMERLRLKHALECAEELMTAEMSITAMEEHLTLRGYRDQLRRVREDLGNDKAKEPEKRRVRAIKNRRLGCETCRR